MNYVYDYVEVSSPEEFLSYCNRGYVYLFIPYDKMWDTFKMLRDFKDTNDVIKYHYYDFINRYYYDLNFKVPKEQFDKEQIELESSESPLLKYLASLKLYDLGEKGRANKILNQLDKEKSPLAYSSIAYILEKDEGNKRKSLKYDKLAAKKGIRSGYHNLAINYYEKNNLKKYRKYLLLAVKKGTPSSLFTLGKCLINGLNGFEKDFDKGCQYLTKAARWGLDKAIITVADYVHDGIGYAKDYSIAFEWASYAYKRHIQGAALILGVIYYYGESVEKDYDKAFKYFEEEYMKNQNVLAQAHLGYMYLLGRGVKQDKEAATIYLKQAYEKGSDTGTRNYIILLYDHNKDFVTARKVAIEACKRNPNYGSFFRSAAIMFYDGKGGEVDYNLAYSYSVHAYELKTPTHILAECYLNGKGVDKNVPLGLKILEEAASIDDISKILLGSCYVFGLWRVSIDYKKAIELLNPVFANNFEYSKGMEGLAYCSYAAIYMNYYKDRKKAKEFVKFAAETHKYEKAIKLLENWDSITELNARTMLNNGK